MPALVVEIIGNASQFKRELEGAVAATNKANSGFAKMGKAAGAAGLIIGGALVVGMSKAVKAAMEEEASQARLEQAYKRAGKAIDPYTASIEKAESAGRKLGFSDDLVKDSIGSLVIATGNHHKALGQLSVAEDIARFKHTDLVSATKMLTMAQAGSQRATKQLGLSIPAVTTHYDALKQRYAELKEKIPAAEAATAKFLDKQVTAQNVIDAVRNKLQGQADAYSKTAAGAVDRYRASTDQLSENLGKALLPAFTAITTALAGLAEYFAKHQTLAKVLVIGLAALAATLLTVSVATWAVNVALAANPIGIVVIAIAALAAALIVAYKRSDDFRRIVNEAWSMIRAVTATVVNFIVNTAIPAFVRAWGTAKAAVQAAVNFIRPFVEAIAQIVRGVVNIVVGIIHGDWGRAWNGLKQAAMGGWNLFKAWVTSVPPLIFGWAKAIGAALIRGIGAGIDALLGWLLGKAEGIVKSVKDKLEFWKSPPFAYGQYIGGELTRGMAAGIITGGFEVSSKARETVQNVISAAEEAISSARSRFASAFDSLIGEATAALDRLNEKLTPAEKKLADLEAKHSAQQRQKALADAKAALASAKAAQAGLTMTEGETPEQFTARQAQAADAVKNAQQQLADAQYAIEVANLQKRAAAQRAQANEITALNKRHFTERAQALEAAYGRGAISAQQFHERLIALMKRYHIPFKKGADALGAVLAESLSDAFVAVERAAKSLADAIKRQLEDIRVVINVQVKAGSPVEKRQHGGPVRGGVPYMVGEAGPELFVPTQSGSVLASVGAGTGVAVGGAQGMSIHFHGGTFLGGNKERLALDIRDALVRAGYRNAGGMMKGLA